jgi:hemophore-related protein
MNCYRRYTVGNSEALISERFMRMRSTTKLVVAIGGLALSLTAGAGIASAAPDVSAIVNSTCTYPQVMAALNAQSPQMAKQISGNPAANAWLQALINSGPDGRQQMVDQAQQYPVVMQYQGLILSVASTCNNF